MSPRILVVDDEPLLRRTLERVLRSLQYEVDAVGEPQLVYELLAPGGYDLVLVDVHLPQISGAALSLALIRRWPALDGRIVLMTGDPGVRDEWPDELRRCPLLAKPFTIAALAETLDASFAALDQARTQRQRNVR